ncbi:DegT/DnrJ/EryC1/StrS family aminotransferase [Inconstantimicrobium mannanitabidum]|uniref:Uncharacterized protein n=1 Tax=Inconstantimicrobium mannanitabidum TaxID=1604901 RepID=A0ACB5R912_9CLOT|nr:DegT/DnrJ/EryC1/StrS family aminotransferase [Clostridium sp. TW13]GKX65526.1 hypothetical protein rsdtw13_07840 [Clostridium sp. TW13]
MERYIKPIGGEQWLDINLFDKKLDNFRDIEAVFLSGGQSAIQFILENINIENGEFILVPSYLCPSILYNFHRLKVDYIFYSVNKDLSIDLCDVKEKINKYKIKAVFFIDYFGFYYDQATLQYFKGLKEQNIVLIEDAVQMLWFSFKSFIGDYVFNSYRKFLPIDGSIVLCNKIKQYNFEKDSYYENVNLARAKKTLFQQFDIGNEEEFLSLYGNAEEEYYRREKIIGIDDESKKVLTRVDYEFIQNKRKENYSYLYDNLVRNNKIQIIYNKNLIKDNTVLGLPILIENRNEVRKKLRQANIYCPVHWNILNEEWSSKYVDSRYISERIITLPIDQRYDLYDMNRLLDEINRLVSNDI